MLFPGDVSSINSFTSPSDLTLGTLGAAPISSVIKAPQTFPAAPDGITMCQGQSTQSDSLQHNWGAPTTPHHPGLAEDDEGQAERAEGQNPASTPSSSSSALPSHLIALKKVEEMFGGNGVKGRIGG